MKVSRPRVPTGPGVKATPILQSRGGPRRGNLWVNIRWDLMLWKDLFLQREDLPAGLVLTSELSVRLAVKMWWISSAPKITQPKHHYYFFLFWHCFMSKQKKYIYSVCLWLPLNPSVRLQPRGYLVSRQQPSLKRSAWVPSFWADVHAGERFPPVQHFCATPVGTQGSNYVHHLPQQISIPAANKAQATPQRPNFKA